MNKLSSADKELFRRYLSLERHELSAYSFENIYIWRSLYDIFWKVIKGNLCVFFQDKIGCFLYLPPLGNAMHPEANREAFRVMNRLNASCGVSRIENVEKKALPFYRRQGYSVAFKFHDYLCRRADLVFLKGNKFKSQRAAFNYFTKHYRFKYLPFSLKYRSDCLKLYDIWMKQRKEKFEDELYRGMLGDSRKSLKVLLSHYADMDILGRVVKVDGEIRAFTFGFKLNRDTFCVLYEITDLSVKGAAQFIFRSFCGELAECRHINIMDDSGLENLKKTKLSYRPVKLIPGYIIQKEHA